MMFTSLWHNTIPSQNSVAIAASTALPLCSFNMDLKEVMKIAQMSNYEKENSAATYNPIEAHSGPFETTVWRSK